MNKWLLGGIIASSAIVYTHNYDILLLNSITFDQLRLVSEKLSRNVYTNHDQSLYYKVWDTKYRRAKQFEDALNAGFFEDIAPIVTVIYDEKDRCRGYVTVGGIPFFSSTTQLTVKITKNQYVLPIEEQTDTNYIEFYETLLENTIKSKYAFIDVSPTNVIVIDSHYYLIDLESVEPLSNLQPNFAHHPEFSFHIQGYAKFVKTLLKK